MVTIGSSLQAALKEWAIAIKALNSGQTIILLRKGGIREGSFTVPHQQFWLYPTYEHQKPELLKAEFSSLVTPVASGWHPEMVQIASCAELTKVITLDNYQQLERLHSYHIWQAKMVDERFKWKPHQPLQMLLLRVYRLATPQSIPFDSSYGGCKSWLTLQAPLTTENLTPVIALAEYQRRVTAIENAVKV